MNGSLVVPFHSAREMCNWSEKSMWDAGNVQGFIMYLGNVQWYLRVGACYPATGVCVGVL